MEYVIALILLVVIATVVAKVIKRKDPDGLGAKINEFEKPLEEAYDKKKTELKEKFDEIKK